MADKQVVEIEQSSGAKSGEWVVIDCVAFFCEEGKGGESYRKKNKFRCRVKTQGKRFLNWGSPKFRSLLDHCCTTCIWSGS